MKRVRFLALSALYLAGNVALAESTDPKADAPASTLANKIEEAGDTKNVIAAIRTEVLAADQVAGEFEALAGSRRNAQNLVVGLRNATTISMVATAPAQGNVDFKPPTQPMSFPDVRQALSLTQARLQAKHISAPSPMHIKAALAGGELPNAAGDNTSVIGILPLRQRGMSWNQIARVLKVAMPARIAAAANSDTDSM